MRHFATTLIASLTILSSTSAAPVSASSPSETKGWRSGDFVKFVLETGAYQTEFESQAAARNAAQGGTYNNGLKTNAEVIVMRPIVCTDAMIKEIKGMALPKPPTGFSPYRLWGGQFAPVTKLITDYQSAFAPLKAVVTDDAEQAKKKLKAKLIADVRSLALQKGAVDDTGQPIVPIEIAMIAGEYVRLEIEDTGAPQIGTRINDGYILAETNPCSGKADPEKLRAAFGDSGVPNGFADAQTALGVATLLPGIKFVVEHDSKFWLYRPGNVQSKPTHPEYLAQLNGIRLYTPFTFRHVVMGSGSMATVY
jgi:hypothetical protein